MTSCDNCGLQVVVFRNGLCGLCQPVANIRTWDRPLSDEEIQEDYEALCENEEDRRE